jgi:hypothetical protein
MSPPGILNRLLTLSGGQISLAGKISSAVVADAPPRLTRAKPAFGHRMIDSPPHFVDHNRLRVLGAWAAQR